MANRPYFYVDQNKHVQSATADFDWFPGYSVLQKQKSINSLHQAIKLDGFKRVLEISSKSLLKLGTDLSAFNLQITIPNTSTTCSVESAFQGSKVFQFGGPFNTLFDKDSRTARSIVKEKSLGNLIGFDFGNGMLSATPVTAFYDWLFINAVLQNATLLQEVKHYDAFTDIEFNPKKSLNCQAFSAAYLVSICEKTYLDTYISFDEICSQYPLNNSTSTANPVQNELF